MAIKNMSSIVLAMVVALLTVSMAVTDAAWSSATATYYGGDDAGGTNNGACGYGNQVGLYGKVTTAVSGPLFQNGAVCGACYQLQCVNSQYCNNGKTVQVTATNLCPGGSRGGWCDQPKIHFDLSVPAFDTIGQRIAGHFPVQYQRVPCGRSGGVRFEIEGNPNFNLVLIENVAGAGDVTAAQMKGNGAWCSMTRNFGSKWQCNANLVGQPLSFKVTLSDGRSLEFDNVAPSNWNFGQTFSSSQNF